MVLVDLVTVLELTVVMIVMKPCTSPKMVHVLEIVHSDNGKMTSLVNVICVTLPVLAVLDQIIMIVVVVLNQDIYKVDIVLILVPYLDTIQMKLKEPVKLVMLPVKNVWDQVTEIALCVIKELGY
jgi:hypothetical protein